MIKDNNSVFDTVYNTLKNKILQLYFKPGRSISVASIAASMNVSRTPVHDAIMKLSNENLIEVFPKSGSRVSLIDIKRTEDERFMRKSMELSALKEMFFNYNESYVDIMETCIEKQEKAFKEKRYVDTLFWDGKFHSQIFKCAGRYYCWQIISQYSANDYRVRLLAEKAITSTQEAVIQNHKDIVRFLRNRNMEAALQIEEQHLSRIIGEIAILVAEYPKIFTNTDNKTTPDKIRTKYDSDDNFLSSIIPKS